MQNMTKQKPMFKQTKSSFNTTLLENNYWPTKAIGIQAHNTQTKSIQQCATMHKQNLHKHTKKLVTQTLGYIPNTKYIELKSHLSLS